jgi:hypothetical protein
MQVVTEKEAAAMCSLSVVTLRRLRKAGSGPRFVKLGCAGWATALRISRRGSRREPKGEPLGVPLRFQGAMRNFPGNPLGERSGFPPVGVAGAGAANRAANRPASRLGCPGLPIP